MAYPNTKKFHNLIPFDEVLKIHSKGIQKPSSKKTPDGRITGYCFCGNELIKKKLNNQNGWVMICGASSTKKDYCSLRKM